jgi:hypothetical protein
MLGAQDLALAGGKGANLGELIRAGFPVLLGAAEVLGSASTVANADPPVLTDDDVAWTIQGDVLDGGAVLAVSKTGGTPRALASSQPQPRFLTKDGTSLYLDDGRLFLGPAFRRARFDSRDAARRGKCDHTGHLG